MLKKSILILIPLLAFALSTIAQRQNPQLAFDQANKQLQDGNIGTAILMYQKLEKENQVSGALFLNLALSYTQVDSMGKAKYYFLKAKRFDETSERAQNGLKYVETRFSHQSAVLPVLPWEKVLNWLTGNVGSAPLLGIGLLLFNLGAFLYIGSWFIKRPSRIWPRTAIAAACFGAVIILLGFYTDYRQQRYSKAVMITQKANVVEQPEAGSTLVNQAFEGYEFTVDQTKSSNREKWSYIRMSNGLYGWIPTRKIMIL